MASLLIAGVSEFDLNSLVDVLPRELESKIEEKRDGIRLMVLKAQGKFIAQLQPCDEEEDEDTADDLKGLERVPHSFAEALNSRQLRFLIVTYEPTTDELLKRAMLAMGKAGKAQFFIDASDVVHEL